MESETTLIYNPNNVREEPKKFTFDYSYWSHDGFTESSNGFCEVDEGHPNGHKYADQNRVYDDLGKSILTNAWDGYNAALFAYGQTGSGKSYSVIGYGSNRGIVPRFCEELFQTITHRQEAKGSFVCEVKFNMLEIYNEMVRDLLNPDSLSSKKKGLKVREHPTKGFYAEGLKSFLVTSQKEITAKIDEGTTNRSIASTNMNETSSRAHTIVCITISQKTQNAQGQETAKTSMVHLVDLAGSERLSGTQAKGDRLKEGVSINQSLSCLGNCIHALAEKSTGKNTRVPFRESTLTRLLMNALGGNSKTVMIAAISPGDISYDETLSTLRYADRAKQIKTHAKVNQDPTDKLLKQLREENEKLKTMMEKGVSSLPGATSDISEKDLRKKWEEEMKAAVAENERNMREMKQTYEERLQQQNKTEGVSLSLISVEAKKLEIEKLKNPHLANLNFDEQLSGKIVHILRLGTNTLGKSDDCNVVLYGPSIHEKHAIIHRKENGIVILERIADDCRILLNGDPVSNKIPLNHNDRLLFGTSQLFVFIHPEQEGKSSMTYSEVTFELAQEEIASKAGYDVNAEDQSMETALLNKDLLEVLPAIEEANAMSEEMEKAARFDIMLVSPQFLGKTTDRTEIYVKVMYVEAGQEFYWPKEKFMNRLHVMKEMYRCWEDGESDWDLPQERDPFSEDPSQEILVGSVNIYLQPLAFLVEMKEQLELMNITGNEVGIINIEIVPCSADGTEFTENDDSFVDSPSELIGKAVHIVVKIQGCRGLPARFTDMYCKYRVFLDQEDSKTETIADTSNPDFNHRKVFSFRPVTQQFIDYLKEGFLNIQIFGRQMARRGQSKQSGRGTKLMLQEDLVNQANNLMQGFKMNGRQVEPNKQSVIVELLLMKKHQQRQAQKLEHLSRLIAVSEQCHKKKISVQLVKDLLAASAPEVAEQLIAQVPADDEYEAVRSSACNLL